MLRSASQGLFRFARRARGSVTLKSAVPCSDAPFGKSGMGRDW